MKKYVFEFLKRGICAMGFGPLVLAAVWGILYACGVLEVLTGVQVVFGIVGISLLVFVAAGITVVYQITAALCNAYSRRDTLYRLRCDISCERMAEGRNNAVYHIHDYFCGRLRAYMGHRLSVYTKRH